MPLTRAAGASILSGGESDEKTLEWFSIGVLPLLLALVVPAAAGNTTPTRSLPISGQVTGLAFEGSRVYTAFSPSESRPRVSMSGTSFQAAARSSTVAEAERHSRWQTTGSPGSPGPAARARRTSICSDTMPRPHLRQAAFALRATTMRPSPPPEEATGKRPGWLGQGDRGQQLDNRHRKQPCRMAPEPWRPRTQDDRHRAGRNRRGFGRPAASRSSAPLRSGRVTIG